MACARCPYFNTYTLLWKDAADAEVICVLLQCCSGPELQIRRGKQVLRSEIMKSVPEVRERAATLEGNWIE